MTIPDIITLEDFKQLARPTSVHLDEAHFNAYLQEAEARHIIPAIGYDLYNTLCHPDEWSEGEEYYPILVSGGVVESTHCGCDGGTIFCHGLKKATAYFTYALMDKGDGAVMARAGLMRHRDEYADHADDKIKQFDNVMDMAELYLSSVLEAIKANDCCTPKARQTRATIKAIGD